MKYFSVLVFTSFLMAACNNKADQPGTDDDTATVAEKSFGWEATLNDSSGRLEMKKKGEADVDFKNNDAVIAYINGQYPNVQLKLNKVSNDTVYLEIPDATYLTQQMGSTGPTIFLASVVYNITEFFSGIKFVNLDFEEGDHASPGTYNRDSFKDE